MPKLAGVKQRGRRSGKALPRGPAIPAIPLAEDYFLSDGTRVPGSHRLSLPIRQCGASPVSLTLA